jgi:GxxExxY protein
MNYHFADFPTSDKSISQFQYKELCFEEGLRLDVMIDDLGICELKAVEEMNPVWQAQILSHLHLLNKRLGYLINFNVPLIKHGIKRYVL